MSNRQIGQIDVRSDRQVQIERQVKQTDRSNRHHVKQKVRSNRQSGHIESQVKQTVTRCPKKNSALACCYSRANAFSVAKATLHSQMSISQLVSPLVTKTPQQLKVVILHHSSFFIHFSFILHHPSSSFIIFHSSLIILHHP